MRRKTFLTFGIICCLAAVTACSSKDNERAVPRPDAWPRINTYPQSYHIAAGLPINLPVNDSTIVVTTSRNDWVTISYPRYHANLHLTITRVSPESVNRVVDNRVERMALNNGGNDSEVIELTNPAGFKAQIMKTPRGSVTPLQILAIGRDMVVSGAVALLDPNDMQKPDSMAPVIDAIEADLIYAMQNMQ